MWYCEGVEKTKRPLQKVLGSILACSYLVTTALLYFLFPSYMNNALQN